MFMGRFSVLVTTPLSKVNFKLLWLFNNNYQSLHQKPITEIKNSRISKVNFKILWGFDKNLEKLKLGPSRFKDYTSAVIFYRDCITAFESFKTIF